MGLYDRVDSKRKQKKTDGAQDDKIREMHKTMTENFEKQQKMIEANTRGREDKLRDSLQDSGPMIRREYNRDFARFGDRFAVGDGEFCQYSCAQILQDSTPHAGAGAALYSVQFRSY